jgi:hypothetical protein
MSVAGTAPGRRRHVRLCLGELKMPRPGEPWLSSAVVSATCARRPGLSPSPEFNLGPQGSPWQGAMTGSARGWGAAAGAMVNKTLNRGAAT